MCSKGNYNVLLYKKLYSQVKWLETVAMKAIALEVAMETIALYKYVQFAISVCD